MIYDVVIAGYGPSGALVANLLGAQGYRVLVIEPELEVYQIPRAVHFDGEVMRIFQEIGLAKEIEELSGHGEMLKFINGKDWTLFQQDLSVVKRQHAWFNNLFFDQPRLETCLRNGVQRYPSVEEKLGWFVTDLGSQTCEAETFDIQITPVPHGSVDGNSEQVRTRYLLACDGASSPVRKLLKIGQEDLHCDEPWLVCDLMLKKGTQVNRTALQICDPTRPASLIPCESDHIRWEFMINPKDDIEMMEGEEYVRKLMSKHIHRLSPDIKSSDGDLIRAKVYTFHALISDRFQSGKVFLLGDAAHQMPPFLGQGMCAGMRDAYNLCWKLSGVLSGRFARRVLNTYTTERRPQVRRVIETAVAHGAIIQTRNPFKALIRDSYLILGRALPFLVGFLKFGEGWQLGQGLFFNETGAELKRPVGEPIPQGWISRLPLAASQRPVLSDCLLSDRFTVVGFDIDPEPFLIDNKTHDWIDSLFIGKKGQFIEVEGELMNWANKNEVSLAIIRPDRQVYGICRKGTVVSHQLSVMLDALDRQLHSV